MPLPRGIPRWCCRHDGRGDWQLLKGLSPYPRLGNDLAIAPAAFCPVIAPYPAQLTASSRVLRAAEAFATHSASQCGFCTPGFVVACHSRLRQLKAAHKAPTVPELVQGLDGNLCRCTGYRPIIDACKVCTISYQCQEGLLAFSEIARPLCMHSGRPPLAFNQLELLPLSRNWQLLQTWRTAAQHAVPNPP